LAIPYRKNNIKQSIFVAFPYGMVLLFATAIFPICDSTEKRIYKQAFNLISTIFSFWMAINYVAGISTIPLKLHRLFYVLQFSWPTSVLLPPLSIIEVFFNLDPLKLKVDKLIGREDPEQVRQEDNKA
jgi:hypothetical protein